MLNDRALRARILPFLAAFAFYSAIVLVLTFPLVREISSHAPADARDAFFSTWILWWNAHHVPLTNDWWNAPIFYPTSGALAFSETLLGLTPLTTPIQWLGGSPVLVYNVMFLLSFPLSAMAAHGLGFSLTRRHDAALITGLAFGFNPYRISQLPHIQMLSSFWMPVALLALHAFARTGRVRSVVLFVVAWLMQGLSNGYYLLFLPVLVGLWLLWFVPPWTNWRRVALLLMSWAAAAVLFVPLAFSYYTIQQRAGMRQSFGQIAAAGAHLSSVTEHVAAAVAVALAVPLARTRKAPVSWRDSTCVDCGRRGLRRAKSGRRETRLSAAFTVRVLRVRRRGHVGAEPRTRSNAAGRHLLAGGALLVVDDPAGVFIGASAGAVCRAHDALPVDGGWAGLCPPCTLQHSPSPRIDRSDRAPAFLPTPGLEGRRHLLRLRPRIWWTQPHPRRPCWSCRWATKRPTRWRSTA